MAANLDDQRTLSQEQSFNYGRPGCGAGCDSAALCMPIT